ncbi:hypothetical protein AGLY_018314 [Aphis glycines]|uniref:Uncharacterized protein n=1 Tax=Aphis glycines TaxID=307491 RepID=A0A6G0ST70_APHGL|nr:hypothetical protein AGLY_018314 [Aphis glycines]
MNDSNTMFLNSVTDNSYILPLTKENVADFEENYHSKNTDLHELQNVSAAKDICTEYLKSINSINTNNIQYSNSLELDFTYYKPTMQIDPEVENLNNVNVENGQIEEYYNGGDTCNVEDGQVEEYGENNTYYVKNGQVEEYGGSDTCNVDVLEKMTKRGTKRKRRLFKNSLTKRNAIKLDQLRNKHSLKPPCKTTCMQKCTDKFTESVRKTINQQFWNLSKDERRMFILHSVDIKDVKRRRGNDIKKINLTYVYILKSEDRTKNIVCKTFFLTTLGFVAKNDKFVFNKGKKINQTASNKIDVEPLKLHFKSFNPLVAHYRREHAPNRTYLPSEINAKFMFDDFLQKHPDHQCSYDFYKKQLRKLNIYFTKLGHEECELCETFMQHNDAHTKDLGTLNCKTCEKYKEHHKKYVDARINYETHSKCNKDKNELIVSVDLQKVIMLPFMDNFKADIFTKRIKIFNESFVPLGLRSEFKPLAILWHEGISGRKQEDLVSSFYEFLLFNKDIEKNHNVNHVFTCN